MTKIETYKAKKAVAERLACPMTDWRNAGRSPVDEWWARQPSLPHRTRRNTWWHGYTAGVLSSSVAATLGALAAWWWAG